MESSYDRYLADPAMRDRIDRNVARLRAEAIERYIAMPVKAWLARIDFHPIRKDAPCRQQP